ncbi:MAG: hypothetical protein HY691_13000 [Chloroflexi bacterium]|nr:hypothetical protein [Chloroflexota bacterium]
MQSAEDLWFDPHLRQRGFFSVDEPDLGPIDYPGVVVRLARTPGQAQPAVPLGHDNAYVMRELLGLPADEVERLTQHGVLA